MAAATLRTVTFQEYVTSGTPRTVDREAGVIRGVKLLGLVSENGRRYSHAAIREAAHFYHERPVNVNHTSRPGATPDAYDRFGRIVNVRVADDGLYGDLEYLKTHAMAGPVAEAAERMPKVFGMSHNAEGQEKRQNGENVVESISKVYSVDVVADGATVKGLYESRGQGMKTTAKALLEAVYGQQPAKLKQLREDLGDLPADVAAAPLEAPSDDASPEDQIRAAMRAMIDAVLDDDSLDIPTMLTKIKQILQTQEDLLGDDSGDDSSDSGSGASSSDGSGSASGDTSATEGRRHRTPADGVQQLREELAVRDLVEEAGLRFDKPATRRAFVHSLLPLSTAERQALIEERQAAQPPAAAAAGRTLLVRSGAKPIQEGAGAATLNFKEAKDRANFLRTGRAG